MSSILLLGSGYTLSRLAADLPQSSVILTSTKEEKIAEFREQGFLAEQVDSRDRKSLDSLFSEYPNIHTVIDSIPPGFQNRGITEDQIAPALEGSRNLAEVLSEYQHARIYYLSTSGVYGRQDGSEVDESSDCTPNNPRGLARLETEKIYRSLGDRFTSFRIAAIYGPGRGLGLSLKSGRYRLIGDGEKFTNRIHVEDICQALKAAVEFKDPLPQAINLSDGHAAKSKDVVKFYCDKFNLPYPDSMPIEEAQASGYYTMLSNQRVSNKLLLKTLGVKLKYPSYKEGAGSEFISKDCR